jgi:hypothetical protein
MDEWLEQRDECSKRGKERETCGYLIAVRMPVWTTWVAENSEGKKQRNAEPHVKQPPRRKWLRQATPDRPPT